MSDRVTEAQLAEWEALFRVSDEMERQQVEPCGMCPEGVVMDGEYCGECGACVVFFTDGSFIYERPKFRVAQDKLLASHRAVLRDRERVESSRKARLAAIRDAVDATCSCGGLGPDDDGVCDACKVWHRFSYIMEDWSKLAAVRSIGGEG